MQQSDAFKILRTRLKTVPSYSFNNEQTVLSYSFNSEQFKQTSLGNPYHQQNSTASGSQLSDGDLNEDPHGMHNGINFESKLQQFDDIQQLHRMHRKRQIQSRNTTSMTVCLLSYGSAYYFAPFEYKLY